MKAPRRPPAPIGRNNGGVAARSAAKKPVGPGGNISRPDAGKARAKSPALLTSMQLHTTHGARKYLTAGERDGFLRIAERADRDIRTLCMTLAYAGCRLSEALALTADRVDLAAGVLGSRHGRRDAPVGGR